MNINEQIQRFERENRSETYRLVNILKDALSEAGHKNKWGRPDTYTMAKAAIGLLLDAHNAGSEHETIPGMIAGIITTHRHLQGEGIYAILKALGHLPDMENATDARNEIAYELCGKARAALSERIYWPKPTNV